MGQLKISWQDRLTVLLEVGCGVSLAYFELLSAIARLSCCELDDLAVELLASPTEVLELLRAAEVRGDCEQSPCCHPTNMRQIQLTPKGRAIATVAGEVMDRELTFLFETIPNSRVRELNEMLKQLRNPNAR
jgi:DNA-binding MarR family transcriptional regulator